MVDESVIGVKGKLSLSITMYLAVAHTCQLLIAQGEASPCTLPVSCSKGSVYTHVAHLVSQLEIVCKERLHRVCTLRLYTYQGVGSVCELV